MCHQLCENKAKLRALVHFTSVFLAAFWRFDVTRGHEPVWYDAKPAILYSPHLFFKAINHFSLAKQVHIRTWNQLLFGLTI